MRYFITNEQLKVEIESFGAEVKSVMNRKNNQEYMWYGDKKYWNRTSPVLFPFVGAVKDKKYSFEGKTYQMGQHGFARDNEHKLISQTDSEIWFSFSSDDGTMEKYPFEFELQCGYKLHENTLTCMWKVINPSTEKELEFSIGAHPGFLCPVHGEESYIDYKIYFEGVDEVKYYGINGDGLAVEEEKLLPLENNRAKITDGFFDNGVLIIDNGQTSCIGIEDQEGKRVLDVRFDAPLVGIWSPEGKNAPFFCIEPWYGRCDSKDFSGELNERVYNNSLKPLGTFEREYTVSFF